ncbi:MAG TPA: redoxin domain-containing protein [Kofleriaceae bacterium]|nr:redoxin domain-containing protein [Kofleriaceae bacterium]
MKYVLTLALLPALSCNSDSSSGGIPGIKTATAACSRDKGATDCLPGITFVDMEGQAFAPADLAGKVVVVNFWATWCPPCKAEIPALTRFYEKYRDRGLVLLGVVADEVTVPELEEFAAANQLRYPVIKMDYDVTDSFGLPAGFPTTYVYDRTGHLRFQESRQIRESKFDGVLRELLDEPAPALTAR